MNFYEFLVETKKLIDTPEKWTKGSSARDAEGHEVGTSDPKATCFCLIGAVNATYNRNINKTDLSDILDMFTENFFHFNKGRSFTTASEFNDNLETTHADMMKYLDYEIEAARKFEESETV